MDLLTMGLGLSSGGAILWALKKIPNEDLCYFVETLCEKAGVFLTAELTKWSFTKKIWNKTIEPYFIDLIDNIVGGALRGFIKGLRSDNK